MGVILKNKSSLDLLQYKWQLSHNSMMDASFINKPGKIQQNIKNIFRVMDTTKSLLTGLSTMNWQSKYYWHFLGIIPPLFDSLLILGPLHTYIITYDTHMLYDICDVYVIYTMDIHCICDTYVSMHIRHVYDIYVAYIT